ncbi:MAG: hypothetical protein IPQ07_35230 [Myxococcales bacterium]|nr:hypothetical protein [Myxococcales bacterium]
MRPCLLVSFGVVLGLGCGSTSVRTIGTQRYYGYTSTATASLDREAPPDAPPKATEAIKKFKRVAFVPPDTCLDMRAADTSSTVDKRVIRMQCGVTMSELEREAEKVGFDVVTWQSLKGASKPLDQAKEQKIDLLFEVNELDVIEEFDRAESSEFRYFIGEGNQPLKPLQVTAQDNAACKAYHAKNAPKISGMTSVLDLKMVQVSTGSVLWSYRHVENTQADDASSLIRFQVNARQQYTTRRPWWPWLIIAAGIGIAGGAQQPAIGAGVAAAGVVALLVMGKSTNKDGGPEYEGVSQVLCRRPHVVDAPVPSGPPREVRSDTFREDTRHDARDATEEKRRTLIKASVQIFMKQLTAVR